MRIGQFRDAMKAPVKAGRESRMKEPHKKGIADHLDPESCAEAGNHLGEALTGELLGPDPRLSFKERVSRGLRSRA